MALSFSLFLRFLPAVPSPPHLPGVNDAFYAGVKALVAKTAVAFVSSNAAIATHGRSEPEQAVMISEMIYSSLIVLRSSRLPFLLFLFFFHAPAFRLVTWRSFSLLSLSLCRMPSIKRRTDGINPERKSRSGLHLPKWELPRWSVPMTNPSSIPFPILYAPCYRISVNSISRL